jgi:hypothetical protein
MGVFAPLLGDLTAAAVPAVLAASFLPLAETGALATALRAGGLDFDGERLDFFAAKVADLLVGFLPTAPAERAAVFAFFF